MQGRGFMFPVDTAIGKNGRMHTVSRAYTPFVEQLRITMYDINSKFYGVYGGYGENLGEFRWPTGMACDKSGNIYLSDELNHRINIFSDEGKPIKYWGKAGINKGELNGPSGIAFDSHDNLFVADHLNNRIQKFTKDGDFISSFGDKGPDVLNMPWGVFVSVDGFIYVADWGNDRIAKYDSNGKLIASGLTLPYGNQFGWISMVIVTELWRKNGLATQLLNACIRRLEDQGLVPVLDATPAGQNVYRPLKFRPHFIFQRWEHASVETIFGNNPQNLMIHPFNKVDTQGIIATDLTVFGGDRRLVIENLIGRSSHLAAVTDDQEGFVLGRDGRAAVQIGPICAN